MSEYRSRFEWQDIAFEYSFPVFLGLLFGWFPSVLVQVDRTAGRRAIDCELHHGAVVSHVCVDSSAIRTLAPP